MINSNVTNKDLEKLGRDFMSQLIRPTNDCQMWMLHRCFTLLFKDSGVKIIGQSRDGYHIDQIVLKTDATTIHVDYLAIKDQNMKELHSIKGYTIFDVFQETLRYLHKI